MPGKKDINEQDKKTWMHELNVSKSLSLRRNIDNMVFQSLNWLFSINMVENYDFFAFYSLLYSLKY